MQAGGGIILIDKPEGMTSHDVTHAVAKRYNVKAGHTGTLDRFATGLLLVCVGKATKASQRLMAQTKTYRALARLGQRTDTDEVSGQVVASSLVVPPLPAIEDALALFRGPIQQVPPVYSAKKVHGRRSSQLATWGRPPALAAVTKVIHDLRLIRYDYPDLELMLSCSSGTYVRALVRDLGERLGCGAHTRALRRTRIGPFQVEEALPYTEALGGAQTLDEKILPLAEALSRLEPAGAR